MSAPLHPWPPALEAALIARHEAGDKVKVIAAALGRPLGAVAQRIDRLVAAGRLRRRHRRWSAADNRVLLAALGAGIGYDDLGEVFGCSRWAVKVQAGKLRKAQGEAGAAPLRIVRMEGDQAA